MCFSASISFTSSAFLAVNSAFGIYFSLRGNKKLLALSLMPVFFAIQQFSEGMIWIHTPLGNPTIWAFIFLFFAFFLYPPYQSFSCYWITKNKIRKTLIFWTGLLALIFSTLLFVSVILTPDLGVDLCRLHIFYNILFLGKFNIYDTSLCYTLTIFYVLFTILPFLISDGRYTSLIGWIILFTAFICWFIYETYFVSVWCFYSAIVSMGISIYTHYELKKRKRKLKRQLLN